MANFKEIKDTAMVSASDLTDKEWLENTKKWSNYFNKSKLMRLAEVFISPRIKEEFEKAKEDGCTCPLCGQFAKVYRRKLNANMALGLIKLYKYTEYNDILFDIEPRSFHHISEFLGKGQHPADFAKLRYWGLVEEKPNDKDETKKASGYWRITGRGIAFVLNERYGIILPGVHSHAIIYNGELIKTEGDTVYIKDCLGSKFNYSELMGL